MSTQTTENETKPNTPAQNGVEFHTTHGAELIDSVLIKLQSFQNRKELESLCVGFTSADSGAGVSTLASRLALQAAGNILGRVLLIDANMNRPIMHKIFGVNQGPGILDYLTDGVELDKCIQRYKESSLDILPWGTRIGGSPALSPLALQPFFDELKSRYQMIIVDLPTIEGTGYGLFFANQTDGVVIVIDGTNSRATHAKHLSDLLSENWVEVIGAILNRQVPILPRWIRSWF